MQMAARRFYAYYIRGKQLALIEHDNVSGSGQTLGQPSLDDIGPSGALSWKSPIASITDGLEIEYAYSPRYSIDVDSSFEVNTFYINGWTVTGGEGYLTFLRSHGDSIANWSGVAPYTAIGAEEFIVVRGSNRWNGLHKIKSAGTDGTLQTYTKVSKSIPFITGSSDIDIAAESSSKALISTNDSSNKWLNAVFSTGDYIFISGSAAGKNNGFWKVDSVADDASTESSSGIYIANRYYCYDSDNTLTTEGVDTTVDTTATANESVSIYRAYRDFCYIQGDINTLNDETDTIDLPEYLAKALVYYVKAKVAEDQGDIEQKEYNMREFRRILEKHESSKIWGSRTAVPGPHGIR